MHPGGRLDDLAVLVHLWVLAQVPDGLVVGLREQRQLRLHQRVRAEVLLQDQHRLDVADDLGQVGRELDPVLELAVLDRLAPVDRVPGSSGNQVLSTVVGFVNSATSKPLAGPVVGCSTGVGVGWWHSS